MLFREEALIEAPQIEISGGKVYARVLYHPSRSDVSAIGARRIRISGGSVYAEGIGSCSGIGDRSKTQGLEELTITGGSIRAVGGEQSGTDIGVRKREDGTEREVYPKDGEGRRLYLHVEEGVEEGHRAGFFVDDALYPMGGVLKDDRNVYLYLPQGQHSLRYGTIQKNILLGGEQTEKGSIEILLKDGISGKKPEYASVGIYRGESFIRRQSATEIIWLPVGSYRFVVEALGYRPREFSAEIRSGESIKRELILNSDEVVQTRVDVTALSREEIIAAGIDPDAEGNRHLFRFKVVFEFAAQSSMEFSYIGKEGGEPLEGFTAIIPQGEWRGVRVQPISERFYLVIYGESRWLKPMYRVSLVVVNRSRFESLKAVRASLHLPEGLSLADRKEGEQQLTIDMADILPGGSGSASWYVRADKEGSYNISGEVAGEMSGGGQSFLHRFETAKPLEALAGNAMHLYICAEDRTWEGGCIPCQLRAAQ
ncbi:MAG: hypothetical protein Q4A19_05270 [Johnsonella sp.]|nr:hypothetical protein [Johnsonella sp.]